MHNEDLLQLNINAILSYLDCRKMHSMGHTPEPSVLGRERNPLCSATFFNRDKEGVVVGCIVHYKGHDLNKKVYTLIGR